MNKIVLTLASLALAVPALAEQPAAKQYSFEHEGVHYAVTETSANGVRHLTGEVVRGGTAQFDLQVKNGWVSGTFDGVSVYYREPAAKAVPARLASR